MKDSRGVERGKCTKCPGCSEYVRGTVGLRCITCNCPPGVHENLSAAAPIDGSISSIGTIHQLAFTLPSVCVVPGCNQEVEFDPNSGTEHAFCCHHNNTYTSDCVSQYLPVEDDDSSLGPQDQMQTVIPLPVPQQLPPPSQTTKSHTPIAPSPPVIQQAGVKKCAIEECQNPCYIDAASGIVHECCGFSHAMEYQRRLAIEQNQQFIKGITHCLLPECSRQTWPFQNYCGKTHAQEGIKRGLMPPPPQVDTSGAPAQKDDSMCILPGCYKKKYMDPNGTRHPYCGRTHAAQGKQMGVVPAAESVQDQCELPGCTKPKRKEGDHVHEYCCRDHSKQDEPNRDARLLTDYSEVKRFLSGFKNMLTVVRIDPNPEAEPGGQLFKNYKVKALSLPKHQRRSCLAFHGTAEANIPSICKTGYDKGRRNMHGQVHGAGEYFATTPRIPLKYCSGGRKMFLNELLLGQNGVHHTQTGEILVMKDPAHDLPRYVITFKQ